MLGRCTNRKNPRYGVYGGRGIKVCERWLKFENFLADMGPRPEGTSIDRIDNDGDYEPGNCRWATRKEQARNTTQNIVLAHDGILSSIAEWSERTGIKPRTISARLANGWSFERTLTTPVRVWRYGDDKPWVAAGMSCDAWYRVRTKSRRSAT